MERNIHTIKSTPEECNLEIQATANIEEEHNNIQGDEGQERPRDQERDMIDKEKIQELEEVKRQEKEMRDRRITLGENNPNKPSKTILLLGETGTGKSSLKGALDNYVKGVKFEDTIRFNIVELQRKGLSESKTSAVTVYDIFPDEDSGFPFNLTIIDTPGYGVTREMDHETVAIQLHDFFRSKNRVNNIDAVGLVLKASQNRLSDKQKSIFDEVMSLFGKDLKHNIVALITHSDGGPATNAIQALKDVKIPCAEDEKGEPVHFLFNNRTTEAIAEKYKVKEERALRNAWETTMDGMKALSEFLKEVQPQQLVLTSDDHIQTEAPGTDHRQQICLQEQKEAWSVTVDETYKEKVTIRDCWDYKAVCCTVCEENCHYPGCTMAATPRWCEVMENDHCTVCKCHYTKHVRENWKYESKTRLETHEDPMQNSTEETMKEKQPLVEDS